MSNTLDTYAHSIYRHKAIRYTVYSFYVDLQHGRLRTKQSNYLSYNILLFIMALYAGNSFLYDCASLQEATITFSSHFHSHSVSKILLCLQSCVLRSTRNFRMFHVDLNTEAGNVKTTLLFSLNKNQRFSCWQKKYMSPGGHGSVFLLRLSSQLGHQNKRRRN